MSIAYIFLTKSGKVFLLFMPKNKPKKAKGRGVRNGAVADLLKGMVGYFFVLVYSCRYGTGIVCL